MKITIEVWPDKVTIEGQDVYRPDGISVSQWLDQWQTMIRRLDGLNDRHWWYRR